MDIKYYELDLDKEDEAICIFGLRKPSLEEATEFIGKDLLNTYESEKVIAVTEIDRDTAEANFDFDDPEEYGKRPVFGSEKIYKELDEDLIVKDLVKTVCERYEKAGAELSSRDTEAIFYALLGIYQRDGFDAAAHHAKTASLNPKMLRPAPER